MNCGDIGNTTSTIFMLLVAHVISLTPRIKLANLIPRLIKVHSLDTH